MMLKDKVKKWKNRNHPFWNWPTYMQNYLVLEYSRTSDVIS